MATTYTLISSNTLSSSAASVTFSSIPSTYTDLVIRYSAQVYTDGTSARYPFYVGLNGSSGTAHSDTVIRGNGVSVTSFRSTSQPGFPDNPATAELTTANTFASGEIYIPSYTVSQYKPVSLFGVNERNTASETMYVYGGLYSATTSVSSIVLFNASTYYFVSGSSFYLYGVKNS